MDLHCLELWDGRTTACTYARNQLRKLTVLYLVEIPLLVFLASAHQSCYREVSYIQLIYYAVAIAMASLNWHY